jgi:Yip1 domain
MSKSTSLQATHFPQEEALAGFWRSLLDSFFQPGRSFSQFDVRPRWVASLLLLAFLSIFITVLHQNVVPYANQAQARIEQTEKVTGPLSAEEREQRLSQRPSPASQAVRLVFIGAFTCVSVVISALAFWAALAIAGTEMRFATIFSLVTNSMLPPSLVWTLCATAVLFIKDAGDIDPVRLDNVVLSNLGAAFNLGGAHPVWQSLLGSVDVFSLWTLALMTIGISACARKVPLRKSAVIVASVWGVYIVGKMLLAMWMPATA